MGQCRVHLHFSGVRARFRYARVHSPRKNQTSFVRRLRNSFVCSQNNKLVVPIRIQVSGHFIIFFLSSFFYSQICREVLSWVNVVLH